MIKRYKNGKNCYIVKNIIEEFKFNNKVVCFVEKLDSTYGKPVYEFLSGKPSDKRNDLKASFEDLDEAIKYANNYINDLKRHEATMKSILNN